MKDPKEQKEETVPLKKTVTFDNSFNETSKAAKTYSAQAFAALRVRQLISNEYQIAEVLPLNTYESKVKSDEQFIADTLKYLTDHFSNDENKQIVLLKTICQNLKDKFAATANGTAEQLSPNMQEEIKIESLIDNYARELEFYKKWVTFAKQTTGQDPARGQEIELAQKNIQQAKDILEKIEKDATVSIVQLKMVQDKLSSLSNNIFYKEDDMQLPAGLEKIVLDEKHALDTLLGLQSLRISFYALEPSTRAIKTIKLYGFGVRDSGNNQYEFYTPLSKENKTKVQEIVTELQTLQILGDPKNLPAPKTGPAPTNYANHGNPKKRKPKAIWLLPFVPTISSPELLPKIEKALTELAGIQQQGFDNTIPKLISVLKRREYEIELAMVFNLLQQANIVLDGTTIPANDKLMLATIDKALIDLKKIQDKNFGVLDVDHGYDYTKVSKLIQKLTEHRAAIIIALQAQHPHNKMS